MGRKKVCVLLSVFALFVLNFCWHHFTQKPTVTVQTFAIDEDGSMRELESKSRPVDDFQLTLENGLENLDSVDHAIVSYGWEDETAAYRVAVFGQNTGMESDVLSYLEQHVNGYSVSNLTSYENEIMIDLIRE